MKRRASVLVAAPLAALGAAAALAVSGPAGAEPGKADAPKPEPAKAEQPVAPPAVAADVAKAAAPKIALELNKLETTPKGCRVYMVTTNGAETAYPTYQLDLVLFQPDGIIAKRVGMDIGPIKPMKRSLKLFDLDGLPCDRIGSMLVNEVIECKSEATALTQNACLAGLTLSALGQVKISK